MVLLELLWAWVIEWHSMHLIICVIPKVISLLSFTTNKDKVETTCYEGAKFLNSASIEKTTTPMLLC
jgi:hypothetical protein